ncbi:MAG: hypothetical protein OQL09_05600 [Gammaproteobacteria bacterium]|nr:hypothetical protein [Gammaproteobacteria bacterium]
MREVLTGLSLVQNGVTVGSEVFANLNGATLTVTPQRISNVVDYPTEFKWKAVDGATAYVFYVVNARDDDRGRAFILPSSMTSWKMPRDLDATTGYIYLPPGVVEATKAFGFWDSQMGLGMTRNGEEFYWTVMALDNNVPSDFDVDGDREYDPQELTNVDNSVPNDLIDESRATKLFQQISAVSRQYRFKNPGVYKTLTVTVEDDLSNLLTYSELFDGYDAVDRGQLVITVTTPNDATTANANFPSINVNGHSWKQYPITFVDNGDGTASDTVTVDLFNGHNWIDMYDGVDLWKGFGAVTIGGTLPVIQNVVVTDQNSNVYTADAWGYIDTGGADITSITITGDLVDASVGASLTTNNFNVNLWNDSGANSNQNLNSVTDSFSVQLPVYQGNNWINMDINYCDISGSPCDYANFHLGIYTTTGTPYTPPIHTINVVNAVKTDDYGNSQNWDASSDTDNSVVISGIMEFATGGMTPSYNVSSDGEWFSKTLTLNADGSFQIPVSLYNGWNYIDMYDASGNWFNVSIYTSAGQAVLRPQILTLSNSTGTVTYNGTGNFTTDQCSVTITGKAMADSEIEVNWNGDDGAGNFYHERGFALSGAAGTDGLGSFTATVPLVSGGYNNIDIFDANYRGVFVQVSTTAACVYTAPVLTMTDITGSASAQSTFPLGGDYLAGTSTFVTVTGNTDDWSGRKIVGTNWACNGAEKVEVIADGSGNWLLVMNVYQDYNYLEVTDGVNYEYFNVQTTNGVYPTPRMTASVQGQTASYNGCGYSQYNLSTETSVVITGTTTAPDGTGQYWDPDGVMQTFTIAGGAFSFTVNSLYDGSNFINIDDSEFNHYNVDIFTTNGIARPRYVEITSHTHGAVVAAGGITLSGIVDTANFTANRINAYVYDECTSTSYEYSSDSYEQTNLGKLPITFDGTNFSLSFTVSDNTCYTEFSIDGGNDSSFQWHGHRITINNVYNYGEYSYKQGSGVTGVKSSKASASQAASSLASKQRAVRALLNARRKY